MLSDADFPEIFPWMAKRDVGNAAHHPPVASCIARWEDDGGRVLPPSSARRSPAAAPLSWVDSPASTWVVPFVVFAAPALAVAAMAIASTPRAAQPR